MVILRYHGDLPSWGGISPNHWKSLGNLADRPERVELLDQARVDGYAGQHPFQLTTDATGVRVCATPEYLGSIVVEPAPWCSGNDCHESESPHYWPIGDAVCTDLALGDPQLSTTLALSVYNPQT